MYKRLRDREIRLVSIVPAEPCEPLRCELKTVSLDGDTEYDALSYVWGNSNLESEIYMNGCSRPMPKNLVSGLHFLRSLIPGRRLWVDQVCIDQQNTEEKNRHVCLMSDIYRKAKTAFAYLHPAEDDLQSQESINTLVYFTQHSIAGSSKPSALVCLAFLSRFFRHQWWTRVWTAQEMILAQDLIFIYMKMKIPYSMVATILDVLTQKDITDTIEDTLKLEDSVRARINDYLRLDCMRQQIVNFGQVNDLVGLLSISQGRKATNLVDKVYGLAGLCSFPPDIVDYRLSAKTCFERLALHIIQSTQKLDIFNYIYNDPVVTRITDTNYPNIRAYGAGGPN